MRILIFIGLVLWHLNWAQAKGPKQVSQLQTNVEQGFNLMLQNIQNYYAYAEQKNLDWSCLKARYGSQIKHLSTHQDAVLFFEFLLLEFADSHMTLNTNTDDSYRLNSPVIVNKHQDAFLIDDVWQSQLVNSNGLTVGAEIIRINGQTPKQVIEHFPTQCLNKHTAANQQWIINKSLSGRYSEPRKVEILTADKTKTVVDLDQLKYHHNEQLLQLENNNGYGIITINNSLGQTALIQAFDQAIDELMHTKGLVLDLRNTINGGDSYVARALISRLITTDQAYQKHRFEEHREGGPKITRSWIEYVSPRNPTYKKPLVVLVNSWTGSMGEGLTIGLHGMGRGHVIGSSMAGLLGAVYSYPLAAMGFGYQMPAEQLFHVDGTPRELFIPDDVIKPNSNHHDGVLQQGIHWLKLQTQ